MKKILLSLILPIFSLSASELAILKTQNSMSFSTKDFSTVVPNYMVNKKIRNMDTTKLAAILESGNAYLSFNECSDGNYAVDIHGRVRGGAGPGGIALGGWLGYEGSKVLFIGASVGCLLLAQAAVHVTQGPVAGAHFKQQITDRFMPYIEEVADHFVAPVGAVIGAGVTVVTPAP